MKISIIHPTRNRLEMAYNTHIKWVMRSSGSTPLEFILSVDADDFSDYSIFIAADDENTSIVMKAPNRSAVEAINFAAKSSTGDIIVVISDDTDCPQDWDLLLLKALEGKSDFCAKTDDGLQPTLVTMPVIDRIFYARYGYVYFPGYKHMWVDTELTAVAIMTGKYIKLDLKFNHLHYSTGKTLKDGLNARNDSTWVQGERLFNERLKTNFGIQKPVVPYSEIKWK